MPRHAERLPEEGFLGHDEVGEEPAHDDGADLPAPDVPLFGERGRGEQGVDFPAEAEGVGEQADGADGVAGAPRLVEAAGRRREDVGVREPVLEGAGGEVRREVREEEFAEAGVLALAEELPEVGVGERRQGGDLELEEVVLVRVEVDGVQAVRRLQRVGEDVVAGAGDGEDDVVGRDVEEAVVDAAVFPGEGVDVFLFELGVFLELIVVVDSPVVVLVEEGGEG